MEPTSAVPAPGAPSTLVDVAGLAIELVASDDDLELLSRVLGRQPAVGDAEVRIEVTEPPEVPDRAPDFEGPYGDHWDDGSTHHFRHSWGLTMVADAHSVRLGGPSSGVERWVTVRNSMLFALARVFLTRGRFVLHAAAVRRDDDAFLVVGDSGAGKSTLAWAASRHGWGVLGDDMVVVAPDVVSGTVRVRGIPRVPSIPGEMAEIHGIEGDALPGDERRRLELCGFQLDPGSGRVAGVVVSAHGSGSSPPPARLDGAEVLQTLVPAFVLSALEAPLRQWFPVAVELSRTPCWTLFHAADPQRRAACAAQALDDIARQSVRS